MLDLDHGIRRTTIDSELAVDNDRVVSGYRRYGGRAGETRVYFVAEFFKPFTAVAAVHVAYLYALAGQPWKTQQRVRHIIATLYDDAREGLCGNDDCGQMSARYVWSAFGLYPVDPSSGLYVLGSPALDSATITLDPKYAAGKTFTVTARDDSPTNVYVQSATLNGRPLTRSRTTHEELTAGGELVLQMGPEPNRSRTGR